MVPEDPFIVQRSQNMQAEARARVNLRQLVYSSLEPIMDANARMSQNMVDTIMKFSDDKGHDDDGYPVVQLKTLQLVYDQIRHDDMDMLCSEKIGLEVPILSIIPLSNLKVSKSKISFSTEVQEVDYNEGRLDIYTKVASAESDRSGQSSRIDFEIEMESDPVAEGLARVIDQLGQNFIPNVHEKNPIDGDGVKLGEKERAMYEMKKKMRTKEQRLSRLLSQLNEIQRVDEDLTENEESLKIFKDLEPYKQELDEKLAEIRKKILETDITLELARDDEDEDNDEDDNDKGDERGGKNNREWTERKKPNK
jgi:hypothetical protein